jgi:hypothetical protein
MKKDNYFAKSAGNSSKKLDPDPAWPVKTVHDQVHTTKKTSR